MGTCLSGGANKKSSGGMCLMKTSTVATNESNNKTENVAKTTTRSEKSTWSLPANVAAASSLNNFPSSVYLPDGEEKYLSTTTKTKVEGGAGEFKQRASAASRLERLLRCNDDDDEGASSSSANVKDEAATKIDDIHFREERFIKEKIGRSTSDDDNDKGSSGKGVNIRNNCVNSTADSFMHASSSAPVLERGRKPAAIPLRWPGEYGNMVVAPPNRTVLCVNEASTSNDFGGGQRHIKPPNSKLHSSRGQKEKSGGCRNEETLKCFGGRKQQERRTVVEEDGTFHCLNSSATSCSSSSSTSSSNDDECSTNGSNLIKFSSSSSSSSSAISVSNCDSHEKRPSKCSCTNSTAAAACRNSAATTTTAPYHQLLLPSSCDESTWSAAAKKCPSHEFSLSTKFVHMLASPLKQQQAASNVSSTQRSKSQVVARSSGSPPFRHHQT